MLISTGDVHLWCAYCDKITDAQLLSRYHELLSDDEAAQQKRFHFAKHRHQYLITRALVRSVLSLYVNGISPQQWQFKKNGYGKPFISNSRLTIPLRFNLSHTDELIVMAVTLDQEVGVDVEYLPRLGHMLEIADRFFSPTEVKQLRSLPEDQQRLRFFDLWTLKEAYVKACGMGLSIPLDHFSYAFSPQGEISIAFAPERNDQPELWQFWQISPTPEHKISMAIKSEQVKVAYTVTLRDIVPLGNITMADYPIAQGRIVTADYAVHCFNVP